MSDRMKEKESKPNYQDLSPQVLHELARVAAMGAVKHGSRNYIDNANPNPNSIGFSRQDDSGNWVYVPPVGGYKYSTFIGAAMRHFNAFMRGHDFNTEDEGHYHLAHAIWNLHTLLHYQMQGLGIDDRIKDKDISK